MTQSAFKAAVWKELRQARVWLGIVLAGTALALVFVLTDFAENPDLLLMYTFAVTAVVSPLAGLVIGVAQTISESKGDRWALLSHRPVSRSTLFFAKAAAGLILYTVAVGLPSAFALLWMSVPGNVPMPFDWRMALPIAADLMCGIAYFFAGQFIGMREARWHGSRVASVLGIPLLGSLVVQLTPEFWHAILWTAASILIIGAAALGTFIAGGRFETQPRSLRLATGVTVGIGLTSTGLIVFIVAAMLSMIGTNRREFRGDVAGQARTTYTAAGNGNIVQIVGNVLSILEVRDLEGRPMPQYRAPTSVETVTTGISGAVVSLRPGQWAVNYRDTNRFFIQLRDPSNRRSVLWHYAVGSRLIAAYDKRSARQIEWLGPDGLSSVETPPEHRFGGGTLFDAPLYPQSTMQLIAFRDAVYLLDLDRRELTQVFAAADGESVLGVSAIRDANPPPTELAIPTTERLVVQGMNGKTQFSATHPLPVDQYADAAIQRAWLAPGRPWFIWYYPDPDRKPLPVEVRKYTAQGTAMERHTVPLDVGFREATWPRAVFPWFVTPLTAPLSSAWVQGGNWRNPFDASLGTSSRNSSDTIRYDRYVTYEFLTPRQLGVAWALCVLASFLSAALAYRWGRAYAFARRRLSFWTALAFLLGPLALALMICLVEFPRREACPSCRRLRAVTREHCEHCGAPFPPPALDGTEIFETIPPEASH